MKKNRRNEILKIASEIHFVVREDVLTELEKYFDENIEMITSKLGKIDTTNVAPMTHVDLTPRTILRPDEPDAGAALSLDIIKQNARRTHRDHIAIPQAVKDD